MVEVIAEEFGVRLTHEGSPLKSGKGGAHYRLTTLRPNPPRVFGNRNEALRAFEREVAASKLDPVVRLLIERG